MKDPLVSIIIPIYNVEKYVGQCVQSALSQSYQNCELILVNDGSQDDSMMICKNIIDEYCRKQLYDRTRIKIISQQNHGVSFARNVGIKAAKGTFLAFVDSDDWIDEQYVENMIRAVDDKTDIVVSGICHHMVDKRVVKQNLSQTKSFVFNKENLKEITELEKAFVFNGVHRKLFRSDIIRNNGILYDEYSSFGEDLLFVFSYLPYVDRITQVMDAYYHYRCGRNDSLTAQANKYRFDEDYNQWKVKRQLYVQKGLWEEDLKRLLYLQLWGYIDNGIMSAINSHSKDNTINWEKILMLKEIDCLKFYKDDIPSTWIRWSVFHRVSWPFKLYSKLMGK